MTDARPFRNARGRTRIRNVGRLTVRVMPADPLAETSIRVETSGGVALALTRANAEELAWTLLAAAKENRR